MTVYNIVGHLLKPYQNTFLGSPALFRPYIPKGIDINDLMIGYAQETEEIAAAVGGGEVATFLDFARSCGAEDGRRHQGDEW